MRRTTRLTHAGLAVLCVTLSAPLASGQPAAKVGHAFCVATGTDGRYFSAAFSAPMEKDPRGADPTYHTSVTWGRVFGDFIAQKHGGQSSGSCMLHPSLAQAQAARTGTIANARRLMQKPIETDWVLPSAAATETAPTATPAPAAGGQPATPNASAQGTTMKAVCWSDFGGPVVYFSQVFDTQMGRPGQGVNIFAPMANEFHQYLKGRYDYKADASRAAQCSGSLTQAQMSAQRSDVMTRYASGKKIVELEWEYAPGAAENTPGVRTAFDAGYCASTGATGTVYTAGPFELKGRSSATYEWDRAFGQFLAGKYGFKGEVSCAIAMPHVRAQRHYSFHVQGARAGDKKVVETGWELGAAAPSPAAAPNEPSARREAARPAPAATPSQNVRDFATKETAEVLAYCQNDKILRALDCYKVQRAIYNYRMAHAADANPEPFAALLADDKLDCSGCADGRLSGWAKQQVSAARLTQVVAECVGERIVAVFQAKPYANRIKEAYDAALAACKR